MKSAASKQLTLRAKMDASKFAKSLVELVSSRLRWSISQLEKQEKFLLEKEENGEIWLTGEATDINGKKVSFGKWVCASKSDNEVKQALLEYYIQWVDLQLTAKKPLNKLYPKNHSPLNIEKNPFDTFYWMQREANWILPGDPGLTLFARKQIEPLQKTGAICSCADNIRSSWLYPFGKGRVFNAEIHGEALEKERKSSAVHRWSNDRAVVCFHVGPSFLRRTDKTDENPIKSTAGDELANLCTIKLWEKLLCCIWMSISGNGYDWQSLTVAEELEFLEKAIVDFSSDAEAWAIKIRESLEALPELIFVETFVRSDQIDKQTVADKALLDKNDFGVGLKTDIHSRSTKSINEPVKQNPAMYKEGDTWYIFFKGKDTRIKDLDGFHYYSAILGLKKNTYIRVIDLVKHAKNYKHLQELSGDLAVSVQQELKNKYGALRESGLDDVAYKKALNNIQKAQRKARKKLQEAGLHELCGHLNGKVKQSKGNFGYSGEFTWLTKKSK